MSARSVLGQNNVHRWYVALGLCLLLGLVTTMLAAQAAAQEEGKAKEAAAEEAAPPAEGEAAADAEAPEGAAKEAPKVEGPQTDENLLVWLHKASGPFGYCILAESFVLLAMVSMVVMQFRRETFMPTALIEAFDQRLQAKDYQGAYELAKKDDSFLGKILAGFMSKLSKGYDEAMEGMQEVAEDESLALDHKVSIISLIGTTAPMLGLLGTVQGMVQAFAEIASSTESPKPWKLAQGINMALVTTMEGLIVAIPAIVAFSLAKNRQSRLLHDTAAVAEGLVSRFAGMKKPAPASTDA